MCSIPDQEWVCEKIDRKVLSGFSFLFCELKQCPTTEAVIVNILVCIAGILIQELLVTLEEAIFSSSWKLVDRGEGYVFISIWGHYLTCAFLRYNFIILIITIIFILIEICFMRILCSWFDKHENFQWSMLHWC